MIRESKKIRRGVWWSYLTEVQTEVICSVWGVPVTEHGREKRLETPSVSKLLKVGQLLLVGLE